MGCGVLGLGFRALGCGVLGCRCRAEGVGVGDLGLGASGFYGEGISEGL